MTSPHDPHTMMYSHLNGSPQELLDRLTVAEVCKGWPLYRDNSEWANFRSMFADDAFVWTTWSGAKAIDEFIDISKQGKAKGAFILHRENGTLVEVNSATQRALGKMKATITQRFSSSNVVYDVDCDCRYLFFCLRDPSHSSEWRIKFVKIIYEKDKVCPVDGKAVPEFSPEELAKYPDGYKYLGSSQARLGHDVLTDLVTMDERHWSRIYGCIGKWLAGEEDPGLFWEDKEKYRYAKES